MANQYTLTNDFAEIAEEKGTLYNKGDSAIELASTAETAKGAGILLLTGERRTFSGTLYARSMDAAGLLNVADFNDGGEGGEDDKTGGLPLGSVHPFLQTSIPDGWLSLENGALLTDATFPKLANLVRTGKVPVITESEWQAKAASQKSVGYYSSGDGSTTFRLPRLIGFMEGTTAADAGKFTAAGLPNITGTLKLGFTCWDGNTTTGAFGGGPTASVRTDSPVFGTNAPFNGPEFNASLSNPIYGASDTVQPESVGLVWCVRAFGAAVNQGTVDITELAQMLNLKLSIVDAPRVCTPYAFPSHTFVQYPYVDGGVTLTAPANGWFAIGGVTAVAGAGIVGIRAVDVMYVSSFHGQAGASIGVLIPVSKNDVWTFYAQEPFATSFSSGNIAFLYAQGEV